MSHSILSPSSAHRRVRCVGSLAACKGIPRSSSEYADEGTAYHAIAATALEDGTDCSKYVGYVLYVMPDGSVKYDCADAEDAQSTFVIDEENAAHAQVYVDAIRRRAGLKFYEVRLDTSDVCGVPGQGGTGDCVTLDPETGTITVDDLKFGRGEVVYAEDNEQLLTYGAAAMVAFDLVCDIRFVRVAIHQPRVDHYDEAIYTRDQVIAFMDRIRPLEQEAYRLHESGTPAEIAAMLKPSPKACRWCPIAGTCAARARDFMEQFPVQDAPAVLTMNDAELAAARSRVEDLEAWMKAIKEEAHNRAMAGATLPGWKLVDGRAGNRKWEDDDKAAETLSFVLGADRAFKPRELITPAVAEKLLKKEPFWNMKEDHESLRTTQAPPNKQLVREENRAPAVAITKVEFPLS